jgi:hypothetical protein
MLIVELLREVDLVGVQTSVHQEWVIVLQPINFLSWGKKLQNHRVVNMRKDEENICSTNHTQTIDSYWIDYYFKRSLVCLTRNHYWHMGSWCGAIKINSLYGNLVV